MRRNPSQQRASDTVDTILEATAQIVEQGDKGQLTTNHIAERAGYSIGTLYGYFPNKQVLLRALARREMRRQERYLMAALGAMSADATDDALVRTVVRAALRPFENRSRLRLGMMRLLARDDDVLVAMRSVQDHVLDTLFEALAARRTTGVTLSPAARFTLISSASGAIQGAALERPELFETEAFESMIVGMILDFLKRHSA
jgi:AcrR family transcriptional regulator